MKTALLRISFLSALFGVGLSLSSGCKPAATKDANAGNQVPVFSLAWSEYPSWSVFGVAHEAGLLDEAEGKLGEIEKNWNVDIVLKQADYDTCIQLYGVATLMRYA